MSQLFASDGQRIGVSHHQSLQCIFRKSLRLTSLISLLSKGLFQESSPSTTIWKHQFFGTQPSFWSTSYIHTWLLEKTMALTIWTSVGKVMSLLFNTLSRFVIAFCTYMVLEHVLSRCVITSDPHKNPMKLQWEVAVSARALELWMKYLPLPPCSRHSWISPL